MPPTIHTTLLLTTFLLLGCTGASKPRNTQSHSQIPQPEVLAVIDGQAVTPKMLAGAMHELAGDEVLTEYVLDQAVLERCKAQGIIVTSSDIEQERLLLGETLTDITQFEARLLDELRVQRGLGPERFERLLRRNAMLRALTVGNAQPDQRAIDRALAQAFGTRYRVRLCVSDDAKPLGRLSDLINASSPQSRSMEFANACFDISTHPSRDRGGLIASLSPVDPGYPAALLSALGRTPVGACSPVISTEAGFAIVFVERRDPAREPTSGQREQVLNQLRFNTQRLSMQRLAQELISEREVIVMDRSLNWAWANRP